jgi:hypothetical protein
MSKMGEDVKTEIGMTNTLSDARFDIGEASL